jgi:hypothetical protein
MTADETPNPETPVTPVLPTTNPGVSTGDNPFTGTVDPAVAYAQSVIDALGASQPNTVPLDQPVDPATTAPSQAALDQPDNGGGILQQQAAAVADRFDPTTNSVAPEAAIVNDPEADLFPGIQTSATSLPGAITQATLLRADMLRLAVRPDEDASVSTARASAYLKWIYDND